MDKLTKPDGISIHALLAESDFAVAVNIKVMGNFYPRSPCGERPLCCRSQARPFSISIHALLAESDLRAEGPKKARYKFLSTLSLRRATATPRAGRQAAAISIHALLAESDHTLSSRVSPLSNFYPRSPCGERHAGRFQPVRESGFLSTLSLRRATDVVPLKPTLLRFLSTLSLRRATCRKLLKRKINHHFYPRSPCGERPR